jgi:nucleoside diphosphate kinase
MTSSELIPAGTDSPLVFVFLDPWPVLTDRVIPMVRHMLDRNFQLLDFEFKSLSEADAEEIYRTNHPIREDNSWHIARLIYPMGPSVGLLLAHRDLQTCACIRMQSLKGKANPALNRAGQLRYDFMAPNRCLSLMHSSDNLAQVKREASVFFSPDRIEIACVNARKGLRDTSSERSLIANMASEIGIERVAEPGVGALFARVRLRLARRLHATLGARGTSRAALEAYLELWEPLSNECARRPVTQEAQQYLNLLKQEREILANFAAPTYQFPLSDGAISQFYRPYCHDPTMLLHCLEILNRPHLYPRWDSDRQLPQGLLYDRWERLLFKTHLFNFDDLAI